MMMMDIWRDVEEYSISRLGREVLSYILISCTHVYTICIFMYMYMYMYMHVTGVNTVHAMCLLG